jgi:hypothetical protein
MPCPLERRRNCEVCELIQNDDVPEINFNEDDDDDDEGERWEQEYENAMFEEIDRRLEEELEEDSLNPAA